MKDARVRKIPELWDIYIKSNLNLGLAECEGSSKSAQYFMAAKKAFYRGIKYCAWSREFWIKVNSDSRRVFLFENL